MRTSLLEAAGAKTMADPPLVLAARGCFEAGWEAAEVAALCPEDSAELSAIAPCGVRSDLEARRFSHSINARRRRPAVPTITAPLSTT